MAIFLNHKDGNIHLVLCVEEAAQIANGQQGLDGVMTCIKGAVERNKEINAIERVRAEKSIDNTTVLHWEAKVTKDNYYLVTAHISDKEGLSSSSSRWRVYPTYIIGPF